MPLVYRGAGVAIVDGVRAETPEHYYVVCDQCGVEGPSAATSGEARRPYHTPVAYPEALLCESCWQMDVGQEDWLIRYSDEELGSEAMLRELQNLQRDSNVCGVIPVPRDGSSNLWIIQFNTGARAPADEELARRVSARRTRHLRESPMTATETTLVEMLLERYTADEMDLQPGSVLRGLISNTAAVINQLQSRTVEEAREQIVEGLVTEGLDGVPAAALEAMARQALEAQNQSRAAIIREHLNSDREQTLRGLAGTMLSYTDIARSLVPVEPLPQGAMPIYDRDPPEVAAMVAGHVASVEPERVRGKVSVLPPVRTRWQRLLEDDLD